MGGKGDLLENQIKILFGELFEECGFTVLKNRKQKSGTQDGNDNEIIIVDSYSRTFSIHIECKDYTSKLHYSEAVTKIPQLESSYDPDLILFISPKEKFSNPFNDTRLKAFYNKFDAPIKFLTPDNKVEELLALNSDVYKHIYKKELDFEIDREKKLKWFTDFIFSTKPLQKIILKEQDKTSYITDIKKVHKYIFRECFEASLLSENNYRRYQEGNTFFTIVTEFLNPKDIAENKINGLVLLGNPGEGKSTELKHLAIDLWQQRETLKWIPFFREISTFTQDAQIVDYLPKNWKEIPRLVILLDGLDEVLNSVAFRSKLEKFIQDHSGQNIIKFIISCRSNIYASVIKNITKFKAYVLRKNPVYIIIDHLEKYFELSKEHSSILQTMDSVLELLSNPYYLTIFAENYLTDKQLPKSKSDLMERFVKKRLKDDTLKFRNSDYDPEKVELNCKKIALALESMQENEIKTTRLSTLINQSKKEFTESSFSKKIYGRESWKFEHRNLQEYFAAKALYSLSFEEIISFIQIDNQNTKTHPSWLNSISYLISIFPNDENILIEWLQNNDPEVLFKTDIGRIPKRIAINVFKSYFNEKCKKDTLWISNYEITAKELANFANFPEVIDFLKIEILNSNNHRRTRMSAIEILSFIDVSSHLIEIKELIILLLKEPKDNVDFGFKSEVISFVKNFKFHLESIFLNEIISSLGNIDVDIIVKAVLSLILEVNPDEYFDYIENVTPKILNLQPRQFPKKDNIDYREDSVLADLFIKFEKPKHILFVLSYTSHFDDLFHSGERIKEFKFFIKKLILRYPKDKKIPYQLLKLIDRNTYREIITHQYEKSFFDFFVQTKTEHIAFNYFFELKEKFERNRLYINYCITEKDIPLVVEAFKNGEISEKEITYFRNSLSYYDLDLSILLQQSLEETNILKFEQKISKEERLEWSSFNANRNQKSFDLLFHKKELLNLVEDYFQFANVKTITYENKHSVRLKIDQNLEASKKYQNSFLQLIGYILSGKKGSISKTDVLNYFDKDLNLYKAIKNKLSEHMSSHLSINKLQKEQIEKWCINTYKYTNFSQFHLQKSDHTNKICCRLIWFFRAYLNLKFPKEILLDLLIIDDSLKMNDKNIGYDYIKKEVPISEINTRVIHNIYNESLSVNIYKDHLIYCAENEISSCYPIIENYLKNNSKYKTYQSSVLHAYIQKVENIPLLKSLVNPHPIDEYKDGLTWNAVILLINLGENDFIIEKLTSFLNENKSISHKFTFVKYLIRANYENAFELFNEWVNIKLKTPFNVDRSLNSDDYMLHTNSKSLPHLIQLVYITSIHNDLLEKARRLNLSQVARDTIVNLCEKKGSDFCLKALELLENLKLKLIAQKDEIFHVNNIIKSVTDIYYNHKSKPYTFPLIVKKIQELEYQFI